MFSDAMSRGLGIRRFRLAGPTGDGRQAYLDESGAFLGPGVPLLNRSTDGGGHEFFAPRAEAVLARLLQAAYGKPVDGQALWRRLERVAAALNRGDRPLAAILLVQAEIEALPDEAAAQRLAKADLELRARCGVAARGPTKAGFDPDEPRLPAGQSGGGQWTDGDGGGTDSSDDERGGPRDPNIQPAAAIVSDIQARKEAFVDAHLADAQKAADKLGVPVENILGLAAYESEWGDHHFAAEGNNFFGIQYPAPFATGYVLAANGQTKVATFASFADSLASFMAESGSVAQGVRDPVAFAAALQRSGKYGVYSNGKPVESYVSGVAATIRGLRPIVEQRNP